MQGLIFSWKSSDRLDRLGGSSQAPRVDVSSLPHLLCDWDILIHKKPLLVDKK